MKMSQVGSVGSSLNQRVEDSLSIISDALTQYRPEELSVSYNGGKDSVVLMHLLSLALERKRAITNDESYSMSKILSIYFRLEDSFPEVDKFMEDTAKEYCKLCLSYSHCSWNLNMLYLGDFLEGLTKLQDDHTKVKAIFMGTRRVDPGADTMGPFERTDTDKGWPDFMRVNPILDWTYSEIWEYIRSCNLAYCCLYDQGYTSIGQTTNTIPNPSLACTCESGEITYRPAYELTDGSQERDGRKKRG